MATNATPAVARRRLTQFYIEVPSSPVALSEYKLLSSANLKENMPAFPLHALKRKSSLNADVPPVKKFKRQQCNPTHAEDDGNIGGAGTDGHPNEYIYCHQCSKKRDIMGTNMV